MVVYNLFLHAGALKQYQENIKPFEFYDPTRTSSIGQESNLIFEKIRMA